MILRLRIPSLELFDEEKEEFYTTKEYNISLQHSLISLAKWESRWNKSFLERNTKTREQTLDYIKCMTITQNVPDEAYDYLTKDIMYKINDHMKAKMTATTITRQGSSGTNTEVITAEIIYYWMVTLQIPPEYQKWHLNRLLTLIQVCNIKNSPPKKMNRRDAMNQQRRLNEERRIQMETEG